MGEGFNSRRARYVGGGKGVGVKGRLNLGQGEAGAGEEDSPRTAKPIPDRFTADFKANKELVKSLVKTSSPKLRNMIAGYVTHLVSTAQTKVETEEETP